MSKTSFATLVVALVVALMPPCHALAQGTATATTNASLSNGNTSAVGGDQQNVLVLNTGGGAPPVPPLQLPQPQQPQIFGPLQKTAGASSVAIVAGFLNTCKTGKYTRSAMPEVRPSEGKSGKTQIAFFPSPQYLADERTSSIEVESVFPPSFVPEVLKGVACLGTATVFPKDGNSGFETVMADILRFPFDHMKGMSEVIVIALPAGIASASGVTTSSSSAGLAVGISHVVSLLTSGLITPSMSGGSGTAKPQDFVGGTFIFLRVDGTQDMNTQEFGALINSPVPAPTQNTNPGPQYERK